MVQGKFGVAFTAAEIKAEGLGLRIRRSFYPTLQVLRGNEVLFQGNLTKVFRFLDQQQAKTGPLADAVEAYNAAQRAKVAAAIEAAKGGAQ